MTMQTEFNSDVQLNDLGMVDTVIKIGNTLTRANFKRPGVYIQKYRDTETGDTVIKKFLVSPNGKVKTTDHIESDYYIEQRIADVIQDYITHEVSYYSKLGVTFERHDAETIVQLLKEKNLI